MFRLSDGELDGFKEKVKKSGLNQQEYLRRCVLDKEILNVDPLKALVPEMKRQGTNLNQIAKRLNEKQYVDYNKDLANCLQEVTETWQSLKQFLRMHP